MTNYDKLTDEDFDHFYTKVPQERYTSSAIADLPETLMRKCCPHKSCFSVDLYLKAEKVEDLITGRSKVIIEYRRGSNDDAYFSASSGEEMLALINDEEYWPDHWDDVLQKSCVTDNNVL